VVVVSNTAWHFMVEWLNSNQLHRMWKEAVLAWFPLRTWHFCWKNWERRCNPQQPCLNPDHPRTRSRRLPNRPQRLMGLRNNTDTQTQLDSLLTEIRPQSSPATHWNMFAPGLCYIRDIRLLMNVLLQRVPGPPAFQQTTGAQLNWVCSLFTHIEKQCCN
jgi:hypothetical protein